MFTLISLSMEKDDIKHTVYVELHGFNKCPNNWVSGTPTRV